MHLNKRKKKISENFLNTSIVKVCYSEYKKNDNYNRTPEFLKLFLKFFEERKYLIFEENNIYGFQEPCFVIDLCDEFNEYRKVNLCIEMNKGKWYVACVYDICTSINFDRKVGTCDFYVPIQFEDKKGFLLALEKIASAGGLYKEKYEEIKKYMEKSVC